MPYKFEKSGKYVIPKGKDRRSKLTEDQKEYIRRNPLGLNQTDLAAKMKVSRRAIAFVQNPAAAEENKLRREERGGSMQYYDTEKHREAMQRHRQHKRKLFLKKQLEET